VVGSIEVGKLADLVLYTPQFFGTKPEIIVKGGLIAYAQMGDANASIPTPQPVLSRPMFGAHSSVLSQNCLTFVSEASLDNVRSYGLQKKLVAVKNTRNVEKNSMKFNSTLPVMKVDAETYITSADGIDLIMQPTDTVPMSRNSFIF
jgi:urease alpha subunit